jgi:hypothetical protein
MKKLIALTCLAYCASAFTSNVSDFAKERCETGLKELQISRNGTDRAETRYLQGRVDSYFDILYFDCVGYPCGGFDELNRARFYEIDSAAFTSEN